MIIKEPKKALCEFITIKIREIYKIGMNNYFNHWFVVIFYIVKDPKMNLKSN